MHQPSAFTVCIYHLHPQSAAAIWIHHILFTIFIIAVLQTGPRILTHIIQLIQIFDQFALIKRVRLIVERSKILELCLLTVISLNGNLLRDLATVKGNDKFNSIMLSTVVIDLLSVDRVEDFYDQFFNLSYLDRETC